MTFGNITYKFRKLRFKITYVFIAQSYYNIHPMMVFLGSIWVSKWL